MTTMLSFWSARSLPLNNIVCRFTKGLTRVFMGVYSKFGLRVFTWMHITPSTTWGRRTPTLKIIYLQPRVTEYVLQYELPMSYTT